MRRKYIFIGGGVIFWLSVLLWSCTNQSDSKQQQSPSEMAVATIQSQKADFVGTAKCQSCHEGEYNDWKDSDHDWAMQIAMDTTVLGDFNDKTVTLNGIKSHFFKKGNKYFINTEGKDGQYQDFEVKYTFGYYPLQNYMTENEDGRIQVHRVTWDSKNKKWFNQHDDLDLHHGEWLNWTGAAGTWNTMCADCHSTNLQKNYDPETDTFHTTFDEINVACEACHGAGSQHVEWVESEDFSEEKNEEVKSFMKMTSYLDNKQLVRECAPCHSRRMNIDLDNHLDGEYMDHYVPEILRDGMYHGDGAIQDEVYVYGSFIQSKMYEHGVKCTDCHDPHTSRLKGAKSKDKSKWKFDNKVCTNCHLKGHDAEEFDTPKHTFHEAGTKASECISCHFVGETYMGNDFRPDHSFRVPRPDQSVKYGTKNACNECHDDKSAKWAADAVEKWYGKERQHDYTDKLLMARNRNPEDVKEIAKFVRNLKQPAIARATGIYYLSEIQSVETLTPILNALKDPEPLVRYRAVEAIAAWDWQDRVSYLSPMLKDSVKSVRVAAIRSIVTPDESAIPSLYRTAYGKVMKEYLHSLEINADFRNGNFSYGQYYERMGDDVKAEKYYLRTIEMDTIFNAARIQLANLYNRKGDNAAATEVLKKVIEIEPAYGGAYYSLGLIKAEEKDYAAAAKYLGFGVKKGNDHPRAYYNWALAAQQSGDRRLAAKVFSDGINRYANSLDLRNAYAIMLIQDKQFAEALIQIDAMLQLAPENPQLQNMKRQVEQMQQQGM
ncbi:hypothetical protein PEPS_17730 [Persicobacter psychrovividus]|uniref:Cytochrome c domain-containing protein n=2 Tax=Persicobacter psychrovividus TaxID=387638 RepID=A0ABM7VEY4_9BACT|nr:hypothetical protein PEPS_17730 [Persicobacter psychrovividus]